MPSTAATSVSLERLGCRLRPCRPTGPGATVLVAWTGRLLRPGRQTATDRNGPGAPTIALRVRRPARRDPRALRAQGQRTTVQRRVVIAASSADLATSRPKISPPRSRRTTRHRPVDRLPGSSRRSKRSGIVQHAHMGHGPAVYHLSNDDHIHLVCEACGKVTRGAQGRVRPLRRHAREELRLHRDTAPLRRARPLYELYGSARPIPQRQRSPRPPAAGNGTAQDSDHGLASTVTRTRRRRPSASPVWTRTAG